MTLEKIIEQRELDKLYPIICTKSKLNYGEILTPKYIDVMDYLYDDESNPGLNTWVDVEGIGYGWIWCLNKIRRKFETLQRRAIRKFAINILDSIPNNTPILRYEIDGIKYFGFMTEDGKCYTQIRVSDGEFRG
nr:MAG TPA: hypothetical protein [Caudoviricetes sp.]